MPFSSRATTRSFVACLAVVFGAVGVAQRPVLEFKVKDRKASIEYGVVRSGKHSLDELNVGETWRFGSNDPSTLETDLPLISGDRLVAPGGYKLTVGRPSDKELELNIEGAAMALGGSGSVGFAGEAKPLDKAAAKLDVKFAAAGKDNPLAKPARVTVEFASHKFEALFSVVAFKTAKAGEWSVDVFTYPAEFIKARLDADQPTPVATMRRPDPTDNKRTLTFNVVATKTGTKLIPWMAAPASSRSQIAPPDPAAIKEGKAEWTTAQKPSTGVELEKAEFKKGEGLTLRLVCGDQHGVLTVPDPLGPPAPKK